MYSSLNILLFFKNFHLFIFYSLPPHGVILESACLSVRVSVHPSVCPFVYKILVSLKALAGILTLSQTTNVRLFKTESSLQATNFILDEDGRQLTILVEKAGEKEEIASYKQFLLFPQCFQGTCTADM